MNEHLSILSEDGKVIGEAHRDEIHEKGLLHAEVHVWLFTPTGKIIFQHRGKDKDTFPDKLDASVGGHVEIGDTFEQTAIKEVKEETGLVVSLDDLIFIEETKTTTCDPVTHTVNYAIRETFALKYDGDILDLDPEGILGEGTEHEGQGFEEYSLKEITSFSRNSDQRFIPAILSPHKLDLFEIILKNI